MQEVRLDLIQASYGKRLLFHLLSKWSRRDTPSLGLWPLQPHCGMAVMSDSTGVGCRVLRRRRALGRAIH